eukprot:Em0406g2a
MQGYRRVAIVEEFYHILKQIHDKDCLHAGSRKTYARSSHCTPTGQELWLKRQLDEDVLKPCDREISEEVTKDKENDDEGNKEEGEEKQEQDETEKDDEEKGEDEEEKEDENEENEEEDEEREEEDEEIAKDSGDVTRMMMRKKMRTM